MNTHRLQRIFRMRPHAEFREHSTYECFSHNNVDHEERLRRHTARIRKKLHIAL